MTAWSSTAWTGLICPAPNSLALYYSTTLSPRKPEHENKNNMAFEVCVGKGQADVAVVMVATGEAE